MTNHETRITFALVAHLADYGFTPVEIADPYAEPDERRVTDAESIIQYTEEVCLGSFQVRFGHRDLDRTFWLVLIPGNGVDILSDYGIPKYDPRGWADAVEDFDPFGYD